MTSLYFHIPFCKKKCFYCSFVVSVGQQHRMDDYVSALIKEMKNYPKDKIETIYWGGGTPSFLPEHCLNRLFDAVCEHFDLSTLREWTIEANPEGLNKEKLKILKDRGITRVSLGVQTFHDHHLRYLGRNHSAAKAKESFHQLREAGFDNINVDLMYAFPQQTEQEIREDIHQLAQLNCEHVSVYTLTIEAPSRFAVQGVKLKDDTVLAEQYLLVKRLLEDLGFKQYEVSNFAKPGRQSLHNTSCWEGKNYIGLGIGAHSHHNGQRYWNTSILREYLQKMNNGENPSVGSEKLSPEQRLTESILFGLRMNKGVDIEHLEATYDTKINPGRKKLIEKLVDEKLCMWEDRRLRVSQNGQLVLDDLCAQLI